MQRLLVNYNCTDGEAALQDPGGHIPCFYEDNM